MGEAIHLGVDSHAKVSGEDPDEEYKGDAERYLTHTQLAEQDAYGRDEGEPYKGLQHRGGDEDIV